MRISYCLFISLSVLLSCTAARQQVDVLIVNATVFSLNEHNDTFSAIAIHKGKIIAVGSSDSLARVYDATRVHDAKGAFIYPGFIDGHAHFYGLGQAQQQVSLFGTRSFEEVLAALKKNSHLRSSGWLLGRGWDQNAWAEKEFPDNTQLNLLFPDVPVMLKRVDGHAALVNAKALEIAGITASTPVSGGLIVQKNGKLTGILLDNAVDLVGKNIPQISVPEKTAMLLQAQNTCFANGLTSIVDAGLDHDIILLIDSLQKAGILKMNIYAMANPSEENFEWLARGAYKTDRLQVQSFKIYGDGALGSRGACLLHPYADDVHNTGFLLQDTAYFRAAARRIYNLPGMQMNVHCIGDSANRILLSIMAEVLPQNNDRRWRIEHAQVVNPADLAFFRDYRILPSVQPTHATSDMQWALQRLGKERLAHAYALKDLLAQTGLLVLGTDFPVEEVSPLATFYAAVFRKKEGQPAGGFQTNNALSRLETLRGMTIWAAYGSFQEEERGTIAPGKTADLTILDQDLFTVAEKAVLQTRVLSTWIRGEQVFSVKE